MMPSRKSWIPRARIVDLDEMPDDTDPLDGLDLNQLVIDLNDELDDTAGFIEAA